MQTTPVDRPRFRQDLVAEPIEDGGARFIDVLDPDSGVLYRFFEVEYSLACAMDGQRDVTGIVKWADEELGLKTNVKEVKIVISTLGDLGYLEAGVAAAATAPAAAATAPARPGPTPAGQAEPMGTGRWDQPTAMGTPDEYLQQGVVHGGGPPPTPAPEVELGKPGTRPPPPADLPRAPNLELGAPGATAGAAARGAAGKVEEIPLGKPGKSETVETDLAADMPLSAAAVKEAVRQSQIMKAVDVPPEIATESPKPKVEAKPAAKVEAKPAAKVEAKVEAKPAVKVEAKPAEAPVQKPAEKPVEAAPARADATPPPAPSRAVSPVLLAALVLVLLGLGGVALWKFVINKKDPSTTGQTQPTAPEQPEPPPAPPVETARLALEQPPAEEIKPSAEGQLATIVANDTAVKEGDPIARLAGFKPVEAQLVAAEKAMAKAQDAMAAAEKERDAAQAAGNKNGVASAEKKLAAAQKTIDEQEAKLATHKATLDRFLIKAPASGKVSAVAKANAKVTPTDVIAMLTRDPVLVATFESAGEATAGWTVLLAVKDSGQTVSCTVADSGGDRVKIECPTDSAPEGAEVTYAGIDPNAPAPEAPTAMPGEPEAPKDEPPQGGATPPDEAMPEPKVEQKKAEKRPRPRTRTRPRPAGDQPGGEGEVAPTDPPADSDSP
jgi:hypothetical protein